MSAFFKGLALVLIGIISISCEKMPWQDCYKGKGERIQEERINIQFTNIVSNVAAKIVYIADSTYASKVTITAQKNVLEHLSTEVRNDTLFLDFENCVSSHAEIEFKISSVDLNKLKIIGAGEFYTEKALKTKYLEVEMQGVGTVDITVFSDTTRALLEGSGNILLSGHSTHFLCDNNGIGDIKAFGMFTDTSFVYSRNRGLTEIYAIVLLDANIMSSGDIHYKGKPILEGIKTGTGNLTDKNL